MAERGQREGQQLGNYRLIHLLGRGTFAEVYLGEHLHLNTKVAVKVLRTHLTSQEREWLRAEARTIARLMHPHIVRVLDFGVEDDVPFLVMEYAPNGPLRQHYPKGTLLPLAHIVSYTKQVAGALQYAHEQGVIHCDIKPENLVIGRNQEVLLTDFGLATRAQSSYFQQNRETTGTLAYMAPEQFQGHASPASDQYALGIVVYEWLSGEHPFSGSFAEISDQHRSAPPPSLCAKVPTISSAIEQVVLKALAKDPELRFASVQTFAMALEEGSRAHVPGRTGVIPSSRSSGKGEQMGSSLPDLPRGTVTLLFSDIEGSTHLLQQLGDRYAPLLAECRHLLRAVFEQWNGYEVDTQGDSFFVAFARATDAITATVDAQRILASHSWPEGLAVHVRMGLHTGEPSLTPEGYVGLDVHRAARIMSAGHGGQVLLSQTTCNLVEHDLADDVRLRDLGEYRLKDLGRPSHLFQLVISGLPADFPPLMTLDTHPNNLPVQSTPFIGREQEVATVQQLLRRQDVHLLTLTGPGGIGKTRLGVQVAAEVSDDFTDGMFFVDLASISDPNLVVPTIAQTLGMRVVRGLGLLERLKEEVQQKQILLLLDNFEQVVVAAAHVADLLAACSQLKVVVTSREVLHVQTEHEFAVPPLTLPDLKRLSDLAVLSHSAAVMLFIQRAQAVKPDFQLTNANARSIVEICTRLDGLPLAIELAAVRIKLLPPQALLARMGQRLAVLTSASRDVPTRQQTLRNTIAWSYHLLHAEEQRLFRQFAVFSGGCSLTAIEATCAAHADEKGQVLDRVASLLDKSLLQQTEHEGKEPRFTMLESVREYGLECLQKSGEAEASQQVHALYYLALAEEAELHLKGEQQISGWRRLEREQENLRAALAWLIGQQEGELALRLSGALWRFWYTRGYWSEGWHWLQAALGLPQAQGRTVSRAKALYGAGELTYRLGHSVTRSLLEESVTIYRELGDKRGLVESLGCLGLSLSVQYEAAVARTLLEESLVLARELGDSWFLANALVNIGDFMDDQGDFKHARLYLEESVSLCHALKDHQVLSHTLRRLIHVALFEGQVMQAATLAQENLALACELDNGPDVTRALYWLAVTQIFQGETGQAAILLGESLALAREQDDKPEIGNIQLALGDITIHRGDLLQAEMRLQESLSLFRELHATDGTALALCALGDLRRRQADLTEARALYRESMVLTTEAGMRYSMGWNLIGLARISADEGQPEQAARLFGAAESWLNSNVEMYPIQRADYERDMESLRVLLGETAFGIAWAEGRSMKPKQALSAQDQAVLIGPPSALSVEPSPSLSPRRTLQQHFGGLTPREREVARLVAQGKANRVIADELVVGVSTVEAHISHIFTKLGFSSRTQIAAWAVDKGLAQVPQDVKGIGQS